MEGRCRLSRLFDHQFFTVITNNVVLAVVESEVGESEVDELITRVMSWNGAALQTHMSAILLTSGHLSLSDGGVPVHKPAELEPPVGRIFLTEEKIWAVVAVQRAAGGSGRPLHVYAILNAGREGWCVLTADYHTMVHVLRNHDMSAEHLTGQDACDETCAERQDRLVPLARASQRNHPSLSRPTSFRWYMYRVKQARQVAYMMMVDSEEAWRIVDSHVYYYMAQSDPESGWCLLAGFDIETRKHRAAGRCSLSLPVLEAARGEKEPREFLVAVRSLLKAQEQSIINEFIRSFTRVNTVRWEEAMDIVCGEMSLQEEAFQRVCQLPLQYLYEHAPPGIYTKVTHTRTLIWTNENALKTTQEVT